MVHMHFYKINFHNCRQLRHCFTTKTSRFTVQYFLGWGGGGGGGWGGHLRIPFQTLVCENLQHVRYNCAVV